MKEKALSPHYLGKNCVLAKHIIECLGCSGSRCSFIIIVLILQAQFLCTHGGEEIAVIFCCENLPPLAASPPGRYLCQDLGCGRKRIKTRVKLALKLHLQGSGVV